MQRRHDKKLPSDKQIQRWITTIKNMMAEINEYTVLLSPSGRMKRLKPRRKGGEISRLIARLAEQHQLRTQQASSDDILANETRAKRFFPLRQAAQELAMKLGDTVLMSESEAWWATTALYSTLRVLSRRDGELQRQLAPAKKFFALGKRKPKAAPAK